MDARLDTGFEIWGGFSEREDETGFIHGRLRYDPATGIELELVENPRGLKSLGQAGEDSFEALYGQLVDGTLLTLKDCLITNTSFGGGLGSPTKIVINRALFGCHFPGNFDDLEVKEYSIELSSLSPWTCASLFKLTMANDDGKYSGYDESWRFPATITIPIPDAEFDLKIRHGMKKNHGVCSLTTTWSASASIVAHDRLKLSKVAELAWQAQNLLSLLVGDRLSIRSASIEVADAAENSAAPAPVKLLFHQTGKHDSPDIHAAMMLLPYDLVKDKFATIVQRWFSRHQQAVLASNVFFGSDNLQSHAVNVRFLVVTQAVESYHRSLGANEYPQRKRLHEMLARLPDDVQSRVAGGDVGRFVSRIVDTRNYYTHFDHASAGKALQPKDVYVATERLRILLVANLLSDLGIADEHLLSFLERKAEFKHWLAHELSL
jgi:hypothetical protein